MRDPPDHASNVLPAQGIGALPKAGHFNRIHVGEVPFLLVAISRHHVQKQLWRIGYGTETCRSGPVITPWVLTCRISICWMIIVEEQGMPDQVDIGRVGNNQKVFVRACGCMANSRHLVGNLDYSADHWTIFAFLLVIYAEKIPINLRQQQE
jgi:hypothetical protein